MHNLKTLILFVLVCLLTGCGESQEDKSGAQKILKVKTKEVHLEGDVLDNSLEEHFVRSDAIVVNVTPDSTVEFGNKASPYPVVLELAEGELLPEGLRDKFSDCKFNGFVEWGSDEGRTFKTSINKAVCNYKDSGQSVEIALSGTLYDYFLLKDRMKGIFAASCSKGSDVKNFAICNKIKMYAVFDSVEEAPRVDSWGDDIGLYSATRCNTYEECVARRKKAVDRMGEKAVSIAEWLGVYKFKRTFESVKAEHHQKLVNKLKSKRILKADKFKPELMPKFVDVGAIKARIFASMFSQNEFAEPFMFKLEMNQAQKLVLNQGVIMCFAVGWVTNHRSYADISIDQVVCITKDGYVGIDIKGVAYQSRDMSKKIELRDKEIYWGYLSFSWGSYIEPSNELYIVFESKEDKKV